MMKMRTFDKPITIQTYDEEVDQWVDKYKLHATINRTSQDKGYSTAGADRTRRNLTFEVRYFRDLEALTYNMQLYRIVFEGRYFSIVDTDDYMMSHRTMKLMGESYGE